MELTHKQKFIMYSAPPEWHDYAEELMNSARILVKELNIGFVWSTSHDGSLNSNRSTISRTYILLTGLALENALKGLIIAQDPAHVDKAVLSKELKTHLLLDLANVATGLSLSEAEKAICEIAQEAIPYWGRYPVPLRFEHLKTEKIVDEEYIQVIERLFEKVQKQSYNLYKNGWYGGEGVNLRESKDSKYEK